MKLWRSDRRRRHLSVFPMVYVLMSGLLVGYAILLIVRPVGQESTAIDGWGVDLFEMVAAMLCVIGGRRKRPGSAVPILLGVALACWSLGDVVLTVASLGGATPPSPSAADALYLLYFPLSYVAIVLLVRGETIRLSSPSWLDGAVAGMGAGAVCAAFAFGAIVHAAHASALAAAVNLAYPVCDVLLLLLIVGGTAVMSGQRKIPWLLISAGFVINVFGDTSNLLHNSLGASHVGTIVDGIAWPTSMLLISMAMWLRRGLLDPLAVRKSPGFLLPGVAASAGLTVLFIATLRPVNAVATALATATLLLVVLRTILSMRGVRAQSNVRYGQSITDPLTGLPNRRRLFQVLDGYFAQPLAERPHLAFLFIDLNGFKRLNDSFGHPVGDRILKLVSARLERSLGPSDLLARLGGDEFAALLVGAGADEAAAVADRLAASLDEPFQLDAVSAAIGASIGIATAPTDAGDGSGLMRCADAAMYRAKLQSTRSATYEPALERGGNKLQLADELSAAIDADELVLYYQHQLDLRNNTVTTVEALVRWRHPKHGLIPPAEFLPVADQAGLMDRLSRWVLEQALAQCAAWRSAGREVRISVNVTVGDLVNPAFPAMIEELLSHERLGAAWLMLEITETSIIDEFERARQAVEKLRDLGVKVSIDDFGAGFTSLAYLNELSVAEMKLDRRFIQPLAGGVRTRDAELVRATIELGHALGLDVVAEGVEDDDTLDLLRELGCDIAQGYGIRRPAPAAEIDFDQRPASNPIANDHRPQTSSATTTVTREIDPGAASQTPTSRRHDELVTPLTL
jgi:diguanylate cyclase